MESFQYRISNFFTLLHIKSMRCIGVAHLLRVIALIVLRRAPDTTGIPRVLEILERL